MSNDDFLRRWSRLKHEARESSEKNASALTPKQVAEETPAPQLPAVDSLTFESDFKAFMHSKVEESVKRAALKKLFSDPRFNVMDGLDTYIDDYTKAEPVSEELLARLDHARQALFGPKQEEKEKEKEKEKAPAQEKPAEQVAEKPQSDGDSRQDA
jgi:Protein of unknown function (DUF3306)